LNLLFQPFNLINDSQEGRLAPADWSAGVTPAKPSRDG